MLKHRIKAVERVLGSHRRPKNKPPRVVTVFNLTGGPLDWKTEDGEPEPEDGPDVLIVRVVRTDNPPDPDACPGNGHAEKTDFELELELAALDREHALVKAALKEKQSENH